MAKPTWLGIGIALSLTAGALTPADAQDRVTAKRLPVKHPASSYNLEISRDGRYVISSSQGADTSGESVQLWELPSGRLLAASKGESPQSFEIVAGHAVRFEPAGTGRTMFRLSDGRKLATLVADEEPLLVTPEADTLQVITRLWSLADQDQKKPMRVRVHGGAQGEVLATHALTTAAGDAASYPEPHVAQNGSRLVYVEGKQVVVLELATGTRKVLEVPAREEGASQALGLSGDGMRLYVVEGGELVVRSAADLTVLHKVRLSTDGTDAQGDVSSSWREIIELRQNDLVEMTRPRTNAFVDLKSGRLVWRARGSSGNAFIFKAMTPATLLGAFRRRGSADFVWRLFERTGGGFKEMPTRTVRMSLGAFRAAPNGRCLSIMSGRELAFIDPVSQRRFGATTLPMALDSGEFTPAGETYVAGGTDGALFAVTTPKACHGRGALE